MSDMVGVAPGSSSLPLHLGLQVLSKSGIGHVNVSLQFDHMLVSPADCQLGFTPIYQPGDSRRVLLRRYRLRGYCVSSDICVVQLIPYIPCCGMFWICWPIFTP